MILFAVAIPFALAGLVCAILAAASLGPYARVLRRPTTPVRAITAGPVEVAGTLHAKGQPLEAVDGTSAIALKTRLSYTHVSGSKTYTHDGAIEEIVAVEAEIVDDTGACLLDTTAVLLLGEPRTSTCSAEVFAQRHPDLSKRIQGPRLATVTVEQTIVADGARGFASGEAEVAEEVPGDGYRGEGQRHRFRITATAERPLILSAFPEAKARWLLLRPTITLGALAALWFAVAGAMCMAATAVGE